MEDRGVEKTCVEQRISEGPGRGRVRGTRSCLSVRDRGVAECEGPVWVMVDMVDTSYILNIWCIS